MFKKGNSIFSLLIIILSVFMTSSSSIVKAADSTTSTASGPNWGDSLITSVQLQDLDGNKLTTFDQNQSMKAYWEFSNKLNGTNQVIHAGDTMVVTVPKELALSNADTANVYQKGSSTVIGTDVLDPQTRTITITFNDTAESLSKGDSPLIGSFWVNRVSWDANTDFSKDIVLDWTSQGTASNPDSNSTGTVSVKPSLPDNKEVLYKYGGFDGNIIHWTVRINYKEASIPDAIYKDTIGPNQKLLNDSDHPIVAYPTSFDKTTGVRTDDKETNMLKGLETTDQGFTAKFGDINQTIIINYDTQITNTDNLSDSYGNTGDLISKTTEIQSIPVNLSTNKLGSDAGASSAITSIVGTKLWDLPSVLPTGINKPTSVTIDLLANSIKTDQSQTVSDDNNWTYSFYNLPKYDANGNEINYTVQEDATTAPGFTGTVNIPDPTQSTTLQNIINTLTPDKTKFTVKKVWNDGKAQDDHDPITVSAFTGNHKVPSDYSSSATNSAKLSKENGWTYTFENLPELTSPDRWYVSESDIPSNYISSDSYNYNNNYDKVVTNTLATSLTVNKVWDDGDNKDVTDPTSVQIQLYQNDNNQGDQALGDPVTLNSENNWTYKFGANDSADTSSKTNQLPKYDADGNEITYSAKEVDTVDGYTPSITYNDDKTTETITNTHDSTTTPTDDTRDFTVNKVWSDTDSSKRPSSITVHLTANGTQTGDPVTIKPDTNGKWSYTWTGLAKNDAAGKAIQYSANEDDVTGYAKNIDVDQTDTSATITNTANTTPTDNQTNFQVSKIWNDNNSANRPTSVQVQLKANGVNSGSPVTLNKDNGWTYNWDKLDKTANDKDIAYTVSEINPPAGYTPTIAYSNATTATITNTLPNSGGNTGDTTTNLNVTKIWSDSNNKDNLRPTSVTVNLLKDGNKVDSAVLNSDNNWNHDFTGLDKTAKYTITEDKVANYTTNIDSTNATNVQIINTHTPSTTTPTDDKTNLNVTKTWSDNNNKDGLRPNQVTVHLFKDGKEINSAVLNANNSWNYNFTGLDKESTYSVSEDTVANYASNIDKTDATDVKITNTHTPSTTTDDKTNLTVNKLWNDNNNKDNLRPSQVTIHLLRDGVVTGQAVQLNSLNAWSYTWNNLDKNGKYSIKENNVSGYTTSQSANGGVITITNTHTPKTPENPDNPGNPFTPGNPDGNNGNNGGTGDQVNTGNGGGGSNTTTNFTSGNPMVPSVPYQKTNTSNGLLPQTGSKDANILYSILGVLILGLISIFELKRKRV
ncbi:Cna B-type domain-containing protein [Companilactobacillus huachuanensis]|uniref:Cna B-type domain-containing protein n=1 Tax=Companilactobacillus huachuanensis TaxID=2559914 RepID=A0ABW1RP86_9LACO|nr:Cna B-type domain-containing protein [Companilactobacillus huachuanensis]